MMIKVTVIAGPQGSGKTTLARQIADSERIVPPGAPFRKVEVGEWLDQTFRPGLDETTRTVIFDHDGSPLTEDQAAQFKVVTGDDFVKVDRKGEEPIGIRTPHFIICTSNPDAIPIDFSDRRFRLITLGVQEPKHRELSDRAAELLGKYPRYYADVSHLEVIDVYRVLDLFGVEDHAIGHAAKKLLLCGVRTGGKTAKDEIREARDALDRRLEMDEEDNR